MRKPCNSPGCPNLTTGGPRCEYHERLYQRKRNADPARQAYLSKSYKMSRKALTDGRIPCESCGSHFDLTVDHIVPLAAGGTNDLGNLRVLCRSCNSRKGARLERAVESDREVR